LCVWSEHQFGLNKPDKDGITEREHLEQVERQTGRRIEALESPTDFPMLISHVWSAFISLSNDRSQGFSGPNPISYEQIKAWKELTETPISSWEVEAIKRVDAVYMGIANV
tara:strand:+ start:294 stop:626 length:333 start_codon:yes stop_codon:yes gene_type:complete